MIYPFVLHLATAARLFTLEQVARHPDLSWRSQPTKRASEFLRPYADSFEKMPGPVGKPFRWRLSAKAKRQHGIHQTAVNGMSQKAEHWLGIGDIYLTLLFAGGRPTEWITEQDRQFDICCVWKDRPYCIEYQRTPISSKQWERKWEVRKEWFKQQKFAKRPAVVLVDFTNQQTDTIKAPKGTIHVTKLEYLAHQMTRLPQ